jgi:hypothetical protein
MPSRHAQLQAFARYQSASDRRRREGGAGTLKACEQPYYSRPVHAGGVAAEARRERNGGPDNAAGGQEKASAPISIYMTDYCTVFSD